MPKLFHVGGTYNQLLDGVFVMCGIIKVEVTVFSRDKGEVMAKGGKSTFLGCTCSKILLLQDFLVSWVPYIRSFAWFQHETASVHKWTFCFNSSVFFKKRYLKNCYTNKIQYWNLGKMVITSGNTGKQGT